MRLVRAAAFPPGPWLSAGRGVEWCQPKGQDLFAMTANVNPHPTSEHSLYLRLFVTNGGGW